MTNNPVSLIIMILLASFVIDRIATASLFLLSFSPAWIRRFPDPLILEQAEEKRSAEKKQKLIYFVLAGALALLFIAIYRNVGVVGALGFQANEAVAAIPQATADQSPTSTPTPATSISQVSTGAPSRPQRSWGDALLTWLVLVGSAESVAKLVKGYGDPGGGKSESQPIEVTGKLTLEERSENKT